jgi:hypothetical protein
MTRMWALVNTVTNLSVGRANFLSNRETVNLPNFKTALLPSVNYVKEFLKALDLIVAFCMYSAPSDDNGHPYI